MSLSDNLALTGSAKNRIFEVWLEASGARLLVDRGGAVLWASVRASAILEVSTSVRVTAGRLELVDRPAKSDLPTILAQVGQGGDAHILCGSDRQPELLVIIEPLDGAGEAYGLRLRQLQGAFPALPDLRHSHGLTAAESAIVMSIMRGETADAIANEGRVSLETVRTHIRHIYLKLQVSSRGGLFAKLSSSLFWRD